MKKIKKERKKCYAAELLKKIAQPENRLTLLFFAGAGMVPSMLLTQFGAPLTPAFVGGLLIYLLYSILVLSPLGEKFLRAKTGCRNAASLKREQDYLMPLFLEVYFRSCVRDQTIPSDVRLCISKGKSANAFAMGRKTICVTKGIMKLPEEQIKAIIAHEFGHLSHKDTDLTLLVYTSCFFVKLFTSASAFFMVMKKIISMPVDFGAETMIAVLWFGSGLLSAAVFAASIWICTGFAVRMAVSIMRKSKQENEYRADEFACSLGLGLALCAGLSGCSESRKNECWDELVSSHPAVIDRIDRILLLVNHGH